MTTLDYERDGAAIWAASFATIRAEADLSRVPPDLEKVVVRMIHASGDVTLPSLVEAARARVNAWREVHSRYVLAWRQILTRPPAEIAALLVEDSERMTMLRQVSPFAGVLDARTRWEIWRSVA